jgi:uncharacterized integral membrane protein (TIGR00697 family)
MISSSNQQSSFKYLYLVSSMFVVVLVVSNIASSAKIVDIGVSFFSVQLAFDGGTLLFPFAYVLGDVLTEVYGFKVSRRIIWTGFGALVLAMLTFLLLAVLPPDAVWEQTAGTAAYNSILGGMSSGGIVLASIVAYLAGEFSNAVLLSKIKVMMKGQHLWVRAIGSSLIGEFLDSLIFISIAVLAKVFPAELFWSLVLTNYFIKIIIEILVLPVTYRAARILKKKEGIDVYDIGVKYSPFP